MKIILKTLGRIYWKFNRFKMKISINRRLKKWEKKKHFILKNAKDSYSIDTKALGINIKNNENQCVVLGEIDQSGKVFSTHKALSGEDKQTKRFIKRVKNKITIVSYEGKVAISKDFKGDKTAFIKELRGLHLASLAKCNVPRILQIDFENLIIVFSYIPGDTLKNTKQSNIDEDLFDKLEEQVEAIHDQSLFLNDLTSKNIIIEPDEGPFIIDFELSADKEELGIFFNIFADEEKERLSELRSEVLK